MQNNNEYKIIRSARRKHPALRITDNNIIEILVPDHLSLKEIERLIKGNTALIDRLRSSAPRFKTPDFTEGNMFMFLGKKYPLRLTHRLLLFDQAFLIPRGTPAEIKSAMITLYKELALNIIRKRMPEFQQSTGVSPEKIRITSAGTRWGSCSAKKTISFSWKLIQCPIETVDYVIVHELSHLKEMNHSTLFWRHVASVLPDWKKRRKLLNEFAENLPSWD